MNNCFKALFAFLFAGPSLGQVASLDVRLTSNQKPVAARVYVIDAGGHPHRIPVGIGYSKGAEQNWVVDGGFKMPISPGVYRIRAEKGPEYAIVERKVEIAPGQAQPVDLEIPRLVNMNAGGWYSGDMHNHHDPKEMPLLVRAEDLNIAPVITRHLHAGGTVPPYPQQEFISVDDSHIISLHAQEVERNGDGHGAVLLLNDPHPLDNNLSLLFPTVASLSRQVKANGGFVDQEKPIWKNVPINVAFGLVDSIGVVNNHFHPHEVVVDDESIGAIDRDKPIYYQSMEGFALWMTDLYYSFLNCGFRIAASAGSATGFMPDWPGYERVYVHVTGPFSYQQWFRDLKAGHSIATNGPLLRVTADGRPPGSDFEWKPGTASHLELQIDSQRPLERVDVIFNGRVVKSIEIPGKSSHYRSSVVVPVTEPGWIAVRCFEPPMDTIHYAATSPFYFPQNGKLPVHAADARRWAERLHAIVEHTDPKLFNSQADYNAAIAEWKQAEGIYRALATQNSAAHGGR